MSDPCDPPAWTKNPIIVALVVALIIAAAIVAYMGYLPLQPRNDLLRSLQRLGSLAAHDSASVRSRREAMIFTAARPCDFAKLEKVSRHAVCPIRSVILKNKNAVIGD
jgi:hypothetical protein